MNTKIFGPRWASSMGRYVGLLALAALGASMACGSGEEDGVHPGSIPIPGAPQDLSPTLLDTLRNVAQAQGAPEALELGSPLLRHPGGVNLLRFEVDGALVSGGWDGRLIKQSLKTGAPLWALSPLQGRALLSQHSAAPRGPNTVLIRGPEDSQALVDLTKGVALPSPKERLSGLYISSADGTIEAWVNSRGGVSLRVDGGPQVQGLGRFEGEDPRALAIDRAGLKVLVGGSQGGLRAYGGTSGEALWAQQVARGSVTALVIHPGGREVVIAGLDGALNRVNLETGAIAGRLPNGALSGQGGAVFAMAFSPDGDVLYLGDKEGWVREVSYPKGRPLQALQAHHAPISALSLSPDGAQLATGDRAGVVQIINTQGFDLATPLDPEARHLHGIIAVAAAGDKGPFATLTRDGVAHLWDQEGRHIARYPEALGDPIRAIAMRPAEGTLALGSGAGNLIILGPGGRVLRETPLGHGAINGLDYSDDGSVLVASGGQREVFVLDGEGETLQRRLGPFQSAAVSLALAPEGDRFALGLRNRRILLLSTQSQEPLRRLALPEGKPGDLAFLPGDRGLLVAAGEGGVYVFGPRGNKPIKLGARRPVGSVEVSRDGSVIYLGGGDGAVTIWDGIALAEVGQAGAHLRPVTSVMGLGAQGVLSGSEDGRAIRWGGLD